MCASDSYGVSWRENLADCYEIATQPLRVRWGSGRVGSYLNEQDLDEISRAGLLDIKRESVRIPWRANNSLDLAAFARELFAVKRASVEEMAAALEGEIGWGAGPDAFELHWELTFVSAFRPV